MEKELDLVNKVDLRFALAELETQLETSVHQYLPPLLLKLASPHAQVRQAVFKIIQNIFPRINAAKRLHLPHWELLRQIQHPQVSPGADIGQVRLYSLLFLAKAVERLNPDERKQLARKIVVGIHGYNSAVGARVFAVLLKCLDGAEYQFGETDEEISLADEDAGYLSDTMAKFFLLLPSLSGTVVFMPGLSTANADFFTKNAGVSYKTTAELSAAKKNVLTWLKVSGLSSENLFVPLLVASADGSSSVNDIAEGWFKKLDPLLFLDNPRLISALITLFVGNSEAHIPPVKPSLQEKILALLIRSPLALDSPEVKRLCEMGLSSEYAKLRLTAVSFIRAVTKHKSEKLNSESSVSSEFSSDILANLKNDLMSEGWPQLDASQGQVSNYRSAVSSRLLKYEAIGDVLRNSPQIWRSDLSPVEFLFQSLAGEVVDLRPVLQEVLSGLTVHLPTLSDASKSRLKLLVSSFLSPKASPSENLPACRYISVKYVNCAFPFDDSEARLLCILASGPSNSSETIEEASKGLHPYYFNLLQSSNSPDFESSTEFLGGKSVARFPSFQNFVHTLSEQLSDFGLALGTAVRFAFRVLVMQAVDGKTTLIVPDENWESRLDKAVEIDEATRDLLADQIALLSESDHSMDGYSGSFGKTCCHIFIQILFNGLFNQYYGGLGHAQDTAFADVLCNVLALSSETAISVLAAELPKFFAIINEKALADKSLGKLCQVIGLVASTNAVPNDQWHQLAEKLLSVDAPKTSEKARFLAASYMVSRAVVVGRSVDAQLLQKLVHELKRCLADASMAPVAYEGLGQLSVFGSLGPEISLYGGISEDVQEIISTVSQKAKSNELAALTLARLTLSMGGVNNNSEELTPTEQLLYDSHTNKQIDYTFTTGEAFVILAGGWKSTLLKRELDIRGAEISRLIPISTSRLSPILSHVLKACSVTKPALRKSGCIWLLSLVQYLGREAEIKAKAAEIHVAFMRFLADRDEFVQELASRGVSLVYELGDNHLKETLVKGLVKSLSDSASGNTGLSAGTVEHDTQLFDNDVLKTHDGLVSTYKDVLNLASEVGDPSLVYKFMSLAKLSALWSSRKGMAFGLGSIMAKTSLDDMLTQNAGLSMRLIPRLFRYRFDPNLVVANLMNDIWTALVKDTLKTVDRYFDAILTEVLKSMGSKEWRVRQASTSALGNLLQTVPLERYEPKLEEIWNMSFRAMDDIKESVRKEGNQVCKSLARGLARTADQSTGKTSTEKASEILNKLIPFFLGNKGLLSDAEDVREFSLETILHLCKVGGKAIKPHIPGLLQTFVELMSTLEPEVVNYLVLNADKYNLSTNDVDAKRLQSMGHSSLMDAIEKLLNMVDEPLMPEIVNLIGKSVKKSVGLPSKVCGSRVIVSLITKNSGAGLTRPFGEKLLHICQNQLSDRNITIASSYAVAAGYACRIAPLDAVVAYSTVIETAYFEAEDDNKRKMAAVASESVSRYSGPDKFSAVASAFLPLAFIGKHDESDAVRGDFEREWTENSNGDSAARLYFDEICGLSGKYGKSSNFSVRQRIAKSMVTLSGVLDAVSSTSCKRIFDLLLDLVQGKSWQGKELLFDALVKFSEKHSNFLRENSDYLDNLSVVVTTEAKRRNKNYQIKAIFSVGRFIHTFPELSLIADTYMENMENILSDDYLEEIDPSSEITTGKTPTKTQEAISNEELHLSLLRNIFDSISGKFLNNELLRFAFEQIHNYKSSDAELTWRTCNAYNEFFLKLLKEISENSTPLGKTELCLIAKSFSVLFQFGDLGNLEKSIILLARNSKSLLTLFRLHGELDQLHYVIDNINSLKASQTSSITINELTKATEFD